MADNPSYSSCSDSDRMIIDLELRSERDTVTDGATSTTNETDGECSPVKRVGGPANVRSVRLGGHLSVGDEDLDDILHRSERSETDYLSTNSDCYGADVSQSEDNPFDAQEGENEGGSKRDDSDAENRSAIREKLENNDLEATEKAKEEYGGEDKGMAVQNMPSSPEEGEVVENSVVDEKEADSQGEIFPGHGDTVEETSRDGKEGGPQDTKSSLRHGETMEVDVETNKVDIAHRVTGFPEHSISFELSDTFLDNMNPQDDSQDLDEGIEENDTEENQQGVAGEAAKEDIGDSENFGIVEGQCRSPEQSCGFELSETFLDNLNPQDDSQDLGDEHEETSKEDEPRAGEMEVKDDSVENMDTSVSERPGSSPEHTGACSLARDETMEVELDSDKEAVSHRVSGSPEHSVPYELSETFLDNLNPQDDSQDLEEETEEKDNENTVSNIIRDELSSFLGVEEKPEEEASSHIPGYPAGNDEAASPAQQNMAIDEISPPLKLTTPALDEPASSHVHQETTSGEASSPTQPKSSIVSEPSSPCLANTTQDTASLSPDENQSGDKSDIGEVMRDVVEGETSPQRGSETAAGDDITAGGHTTAEDLPPNVEQTVTAERGQSPCQGTSAGEDCSPSEENMTTENSASPVIMSKAETHEDESGETTCTKTHGDESGETTCTETHKDKSDETTSTPAVQNNSSSSQVGSEEACVGTEEATSSSPEELQTLPVASNNPEEDLQKLPSSKEKDEESSEKGDEVCVDTEEAISDDPEKDQQTLPVTSDNPEEDLHGTEEGTSNSHEDLQTLPSSEGKDEEESSEKGDDDDEDAREEGEYSSSPSPSSDLGDSQDGNTSEVLQVSADEAVTRNKDTDNKISHKHKKSGGVRNLSLQEKPQLQSSRDNHHGDGGNTAVVVDEISDYEIDSIQDRLKKEKLDKEDKHSSDTNVEDKGGKTVQSNDEDDSDDDVQIIEGPPQEPIDTLIVDDDEDEVALSKNNVTATKPPVPESPKSSKKKRTVEQDGHDLRIVVRDERREKEDSDSRRHRRHERDRREERRPDSHRRSESDRKFSDRSSRRRHHRSRSRSRERRRRRSRSRSHSRDRSSKRRHQRDRSRDKSADRERSSHRKRRRDRSRERRRRSHSRSRSPKRSREDSWDKENRDDREHGRSKRRRYHRDEDKRRESQVEKERRSTRHEESSPPSKRDDAFTKDSSDSSSDTEKSDDESEVSVKEAVQSSAPVDKPEKQEVVLRKEAEVMPADIPIPEPQDIPIPKPEDIPVPETEHIPPAPQPISVPVPQPKLIPGPPLFPVILQSHPMFENPPLPPPEEEPMENPPEPPPLPPRWPEVLPTKGEGLLPTPIRRKAALEEAGAVYDPAHPTEDEGERFRFPPGVPSSSHPPPPEMLGGPPPQLPGQIMSDGTFVPTPGEGGLLGPPPQRVPPMQPGRFGPPRPMIMNHVVMDRPPFNNAPYPGPPPLPGFRMEMGGPGGILPIQNQFGQGPPPPGPPPGFHERFDDGPPGPPVGQFPLSVHSGVPEMTVPPLGLPPPDMHLMSHPPPQDLPEKPGGEEEFDKTLAKLVMAQNLLTVMNDRKPEEEPDSLPQPPAMFKVPPPSLEAQSRSPKWFQPSLEAPMEQLEDSTEVMDMDMSPMEEECELQMFSPPEEEAGGESDKGKKPKPLAAIDLRAISNAILKLTSAVADDVPASAVDLTNKEKYMRKLHLQERVVDEVKQALRPFYSHKKINKEEYKAILRKAVPKVCHSKSGDINPQKIQQLVEGYVEKFQKQRQHVDQKVKPASPMEMGKANGERAKPAR
ncbi:hypothetical protein ACOMHN_026602 [Nucella lapillus]